MWLVALLKVGRNYLWTKSCVVDLSFGARSADPLSLIMYPDPEGQLFTDPSGSHLAIFVAIEKSMSPKRLKLNKYCKIQIFNLDPQHCLEGRHQHMHIRSQKES